MRTGASRHQLSHWPLVLLICQLVQNWHIQDICHFGENPKAGTHNETKQILPLDLFLSQPVCNGDWGESTTWVHLKCIGDRNGPGLSVESFQIIDSERTLPASSGNSYQDAFFMDLIIGLKARDQTNCC